MHRITASTISVALFLVAGLACDDKEGSSDLSSNETDSTTTCIERAQKRGGLLTLCSYQCGFLDAEGSERGFYEQMSYAEQAMDPDNECFQLRFAFEECIASFTCSDLEAFNADREGSVCGAEWSALEPRYQECAFPQDG